MKFLIPLCIVLLLSYSCKKKDECRDRQDKPLNARVVESIPYTDGQEVAFTTNTQGTEFLTVNMIFQILRPDIPKICEEYLEVNLLEKGTAYPFIKFLQRGSTETDSVVQFTISPYKNDKYDIIQFVVRDDGELHSFLFNGESSFHDTITSNNFLYKKVLELQWDERIDPQEITRLLYNKEYGIIRYETKDGLIGNRVVSVY
jgi:hypothetical protein